MIDKNILEIKINEIKTLVKNRNPEKILLSINNLLPHLEVKDKDNYSAYVFCKISSVSCYTVNKAFSILQNELSLFPYEEKFLYKLYDISVKLNHFTKAKECLNTLLQVNPENNEVRLNLAKIFIKEKNYLDAIFELNKIIYSGYHDKDVYLLLINILEKEEIISLSSHFLKDMNKLFPSNLDLIVKEASLLSKLGYVKDTFPLIHKFFLINIEDNKIDQKLINDFNNYANIYNQNLKRDLLCNIFIRIILFNKDKNNVETKLMIERISKQYKLGVIYHYFYNNKKNDLRFLLTHDKYSPDDIMENIIFLAQNKEYLLKELSLKSFLDKTELIHLIKPNLTSYTNILSN